MTSDEAKKSSNITVRPKNDDTGSFSEKKIALGVPIDHGWAWMCAVAPVTNGLAHRFGTRKVIFMGGLLVSFANLVSVFAASIQYLCLSYGCLLGIGFSMIHAPSLVFVSSYFLRHRSLAVSITLAGASVGSFIMPPLTYFLIETYGLRGTFLILSGLHLNACVCATLMRPMSYFEINGNKKITCRENMNKSSASIPLISSESSQQSRQIAHKLSFSLEDIRNSEKNDNHLTQIRKVTSENHLIGRKQLFEASDPAEQNRLHMEQIQSASNANYSIFASFGDIAVVRLDNRTHLSLSGSDNCTEQKKRNSLLSNDSNLTEKTFCQSLYHNLRHSLNWKLWCEPTFFLLALNISVVTQGLPLFFMILPSYTVDVGMGKEAGSNIIFWMGISDLITRLSIGWISDRLSRYEIRTTVYLICIILESLIWFILPSLSNFGLAGIIVGSQFMAMFGGAIISLAPIILSDFLGISNLSSAWGFAMLIESVVLFSVPMLLGYLRDETTSWFISIIVIGSLLLVGGLFLISAIIVEKLCNHSVDQLTQTNDA